VPATADRMPSAADGEQYEADDDQHQADGPQDRDAGDQTDSRVLLRWVCSQTCGLRIWRLGLPPDSSLLGCINGGPVASISCSVSARMVTMVAAIANPVSVTVSRQTSRHDQERNIRCLGVRRRVRDVASRRGW
jgi:hypothetical protein